jgi:hypothetical protein
MRLVRALGDVTVGTVIVMVHAALEAYELRARPRDPRRESWPQPSTDRRASDRPQ